MKKHLKDIKRIQYSVDKSNYNYILDQSERTIHFPAFQKFLQTLNQEDFLLYPSTDNFKSKIVTGLASNLTSTLALANV